MAFTNSINLQLKMEMYRISAKSYRYPGAMANVPEINKPVF